MATRVASLSDLPDVTPVRVDVEGIPICLVRLGGDVRAIHDVCSHEEWSLSDGGQVFDAEVECSLHGSSFSLDDGHPSSLPAMVPVPTYAVTIDGDDVLIDVSVALNGAPTPDF
ncbi:MAG: non-heme iron oxygenase ferredoxin subunit [Nitriliruptor sp.]|uniref:non-heme iron oxygenase ferredoxin subunit n=1 Tax=Nitriliruptor sp. TaxID=2448056 RepID=UPI0034A09BA6